MGTSSEGLPHTFPPGDATRTFAELIDAEESPEVRAASFLGELEPH